MENYKGKFTSAPKKTKPKQRKRKNGFQRFVSRVKKNKRYQIALYILLCLLISLLARGYQYIKDKDKYEELMNIQKEEIVEEYEEQLADLRLAHQEEVEDIRADYEHLTPEEQLVQEAEYIAKVLYGTARDNSERDQHSVVWCILNRVDSAGYPNTVQGVCQQASQWMGYSDDNPILNSLFEIAKKELETWHSNYRPVSKDYVYMSWSSSEIKLRDTYNKEADTQYWQAG